MEWRFWPGRLALDSRVDDWYKATGRTVRRALAMTSVELLDEMDHLTRRLVRNVECCERSVAGRLRLSFSQACTLQTLGELAETTMNGLADEMRLHGTTMTRMVDVLVTRGLVDRLPDLRDRRVVRVRLSTAGQETVAELRRCKHAMLGDLLAGVPEGDLHSITAGLARLVALAERMGADHSPSAPRR